jgi:peptide/nickel transport system permease protein
MIRFAVRRLVQAVPLLLVVSSLTFILISFIPGSVAAALYGLSATPAQQAQINRKLGFDQPIYVQYWHWLDHAIHGSLGSSLLNGQSVTTILDGRLAVTLTLVVATVAVVAVVGIGLGVLTALRGGAAARWVDRLSWLGQGVPNFWVALILVAIFAVSLRLLPAQGYVPFSVSSLHWFESFVLPVLALSLGPVAVVMKQARTSMVEELSREYVRTLRAAGVSERSIVYRHVLKNAAGPTLTVLGLVFVGLLGGTVVVETVFGLPGLGSLAVSSVPQHDLPVIEGVVLYFTMMVVIVNFLLDVLYSLLNPKVRIS